MAFKKLVHSYDKETLAKAADLLTDCYYSTESFVNFFMKDSPENNFLVPTRNHMIVNDVPPFQSEMFEMLDDMNENGGRIAMASPRGFMKSTTCSVEFPLKCALYKTFREILIVSNSEALAITFLRSIKSNYESNERIHRYFGKLWSDKWTESHLITKDKVSIRAVGWGAQIRGFRPDLIILDDIETDETVASEDIRRKMKEWILKAAINSLSIDGCMIWVGTLISRLALLYDWVHNPPEGWKSKLYKGYKDGIQESGHELWPDVWTHERLQQKKSEIGSWAFASEILNDPIPSEGNRFNPDKFSFYDKEPNETGVYIAIDPAFSEQKTADYGVILVVKHDNKDILYVDSYIRKQTTARNLIDEFKRVYKLYATYPGRVRAVGIEDVGPQKAFYQQLTQECYQEGLNAPFKKLTGMINTTRGVMRNKEDRITYAIQPRLESGRLKFKKDQNDLLDELTLFPESKHDDVIDALAYAIALVEPLQDYSGVVEEADQPETILDNGTTGYGELYGEKEADEIYIR